MQIAFGPTCDYETLTYYPILWIDEFARNLHVAYMNNGRRCTVHLDKAHAITIDYKGQFVSYTLGDDYTHAVIDWYG
ncbi:hypothetical protein [Stenotrophomonas phage BUCT608]|nr:hypothetical protein [Stenotrophomonas phage BUCT608]QYC97397.1 hypothetical protein [Stenotrophomonas phage BUCT608]